MARPEKNTVNYFPFLCKEGKAMYYIENKYGNDGFATWVKILRQLAVTNNHFLDLSDKVEVMFLASKCNVSEQILLQIIQDLCDLKELNTELWGEYSVVWSDKFMEHIQFAYEKRKNNPLTLIELKENLLSLRGKKLDKSSSEGCESTQTKLNKTKLNKTKLNNTIVEVKKTSTFQECMKVYDIFIQAQTGLKADIDGLSGKSLKGIIAYLEKNVKDKADLEKSIPEAFEFILKNYERWDKFHQGQLKLNQIKSNLVNIINSIKNGKSQQNGIANPTEQILASIHANPEAFNA